MKKIKFNHISITNFRNINELEFDFNDKTTEIVGENGLGKTNTLSAIMWCLFGKDIYDVKQFTISPIIDGKEDNSINTIVKLVLNDNYVIERSYKNRKTDLKTGWIIDGKENLVSITQSNYLKELSEEVADESTFKSLSNINYVPNLNWKDLKKLIFDLIGDISDDEVLLRDNFELIEEYVRKFGIEQTQKLLQETNKELNTDIKRLETEYQTLLNTKEKYVANESEQETLSKRKEEIEQILFDYESSIKEKQKQLDRFNSLENSVKEKQNELEHLENAIDYDKQMIKDYEELYKNSGEDIEILRSRELQQVDNELQQLANCIQTIDMNIAKLTNDIKVIRETGNELNAKEIKVENDTCNACGQHLPEEMIKNTLENLKKEQLKDLEDLRNRYTLAKETLESNEDRKEELKKQIEKVQMIRKEVENKVYEVQNETDKQKQLRVAKEQKEIELKDKTTKYETLKEEYNVAKATYDRMEKPCFATEDNTPLRLELDDINNKLATTITLNKISEDVENTLKELNNKKDNLTINKNKISETIKFNNVKADLLQKKVRNYFKIVNFRTKEFTLDGEEQETFKIVNDKNVEFKEVNTGQKILLGIDLLQGIMKAKDIYVPMIIDGVEVLTSDLPECESQLIITRAIKDIKNLEVK